MRLGGVILCGGESTRMGQSKAMLPFGGSTLLDCVVQRLRLVTKEIAIAAAAGQDLPPHLADCEIVRDEFPQRGPLEGVRIGLRALAGRCEIAYVTSCDAPFLNASVVTFLSGMLGDAKAVVPIAGGRLEPLAAIYRTSLYALAGERLDRGEAKLADWATAANPVLLDVAKLREIDPQLDFLKNLNTPQQYQAAISK